MPARLCPRPGATLPRRYAFALLAVPAAVAAQTAAPTAPTAQLPPVVVTATRTSVLAFEVPASIDRIDGDDVRSGRAQVNISESLGAVPGLLARDRQNYAQDVQISVRGFGARSTFGIRGVRLYVDGIPATLPDGQGQISNVDLGSVGRIEVLRGPFSALYGNSSGGVIQVFTQEGAGRSRIGTTVSSGSDGLVRVGVDATGVSEGVGYVISYSRFHTDGYRDHSETERRLGNAKLTWRDDDNKFTLVANSVALPEAQDPLGLTRAQFGANPRGVDASALTFDTRKSVNQSQGGLTWERRLGADDSLQLMGYGGHRGTEQFQSIPVATQASPLHPGGVINLDRDYRGADVRWTHKGQLMDAPLTVVSGLAWDALEEQRVGLQNFTGVAPATVTGVRGALRRNERNEVSNLDQYVQASWQATERWGINAGLRHSRVKFTSTDAYIVGTNPDDSGGATYSAWLPVVGASFAATPDLRLYATAGRGFETPTLNELAYRANGQTGLNFGLQSAHSTSLEAGVKARLGAGGELSAAVFQTDTDDEIVTLTNAGGRTTFQNAGGTRRRGLELGWSTAWAEHLRPQLALTWLDAIYRDGFLTCTAAPCTTPNVQVPGGNRIPGIARTSAFAGLGWLPPTGLRGGIEWRALGKVYVNDLNSDAASGYGIASAHAGYQWKGESWELGGFVRVDNLFDRTYAGSVIVNEGNSRFFEPAPGRTWLASVTASYRF
jgi:iron complex outermembrane receptor protein